MDMAFQNNGHLCFRALVSYAEWVLHCSILMLATRASKNLILLPPTCWGTCGRCLWWQQWPPGPHSWPWSGWGLAVCSRNARQIARENRTIQLKQAEETPQHMLRNNACIWEKAQGWKQKDHSYQLNILVQKKPAGWQVTLEKPADSSSCKSNIWSNCASR